MSPVRSNKADYGGTKNKVYLCRVNLVNNINNGNVIISCFVRDG